MLRDILYVACGGAAGCVLRYLVSLGVGQWFKHPFPWATLAVNLLGCFLIGLLSGFSAPEGFLQMRHRLVLLTGFCGGFTTFSTFSLEMLTLAQEGRYGFLALYFLTSIGLGIVAVFGGLEAARGLVG
ncbi:MAG: fluoride efflux transporter CrcB [Bacteroidetes bacterium]|nr:MAG: fluoride efflux transporter CrcB [Bacteroidota bacterium]